MPRAKPSLKINDGSRRHFNMIKIATITISLLVAFVYGGSCAAEQEPKTAEDFFQVGLDLKAQGLAEASRSALEQVITLDKNGPLAKKAAAIIRGRLPKFAVPNEAEQENVRAHTMMIERDYVGAISGFTTAISRYPDFEWPYGNLAYVYIMQRRYPAAIRMLKKALAINPNYASAWGNLAECYRLTGDAAQAAECRKRALQALPKNLEKL